MPSWDQILKEINDSKRIDGLDFVRRKYLAKVYEITGRNIIAYYSAFLQKEGIDASIKDIDKNGFMTVIHEMDRSKGLDLILHTPGGNIAATESIVDYLKKMFSGDIRVIVPQISMSAGTMIACASKEIVMGKQSNLGPIDPQFSGISAPGVIEEYKKALTEVATDPSTIPLWQVRIAKYHPTFIDECRYAVDWAEQMVTLWLKECMFKDDPDKEQKVLKLVEYLSSHAKTKTHQRHIGADECENIGLKIKRMEDDNDFQDNILSVHHAYMCTFSSSLAIKIIESHQSKAYILNEPLMQQRIMPQMLQQTEKIPS